jgi:hypothetical protein
MIQAMTKDKIVAAAALKVMYLKSPAPATS